MTHILRLVERQCLRTCHLSPGLSQVLKTHERYLSSSQGEEEKESSSFLPGWMKSRLPGVLGGNREEIQEMSNLDMSAYLNQLKMARRLGSMTGNAFGSSNASDPGTQGFLLMSEKVIERMTEDERQHPTDGTRFTDTRRAEIAEDVGCSVEQIEDCIARYMWTKHMMSSLAEHRKKGHDMPKTMQELERLTGRWTDFKQHYGRQSKQSPGGIVVPVDAQSPKGGPCGLAGMTVGRSTKCPRMRKSYKACCGRIK